MKWNQRVLIHQLAQLAQLTREIKEVCRWDGVICLLSYGDAGRLLVELCRFTDFEQLEAIDGFPFQRHGASPKSDPGCGVDRRWRLTSSWQREKDSVRSTQFLTVWGPTLGSCGLVKLVE